MRKRRVTRIALGVAIACLAAITVVVSIRRKLPAPAVGAARWNALQTVKKMSAAGPKQLREFLIFRCRGMKTVTIHGEPWKCLEAKVRIFAHDYDSESGKNYSFYLTMTYRKRGEKLETGSIIVTPIPDSKPEW